MAVARPPINEESWQQHNAEAAERADAQARADLERAQALQQEQEARRTADRNLQAQQAWQTATAPHREVTLGGVARDLFDQATAPLREATARVMAPRAPAEERRPGGPSPDEASALERVYQDARAAGLDEEGARVAQAVARTEKGYGGVVGDLDHNPLGAAGTFQLNFGGGQGNNYARARGLSDQQARDELARDPHAGNRFALRGYLGAAIREGQAKGLSGPALATYAQRFGQRSVSPERAGANYRAGVGPRAVPGAAGVAREPLRRAEAVGQFEQGLPYDEAAAICGPVAALAFAQANGRNPDLGEARRLARARGWTVQGGMNGVANEQRLLEGMGVASRLDTSPDFGEIAQDAASGNPVIVSTGRHYYYVNGYDPATGKLRVGKTGEARKGGSAWMSAQQIADLDGGINGVLYVDSPRSPTPSVAVPATPGERPESEFEPPTRYNAQNGAYSGGLTDSSTLNPFDDRAASEDPWMQADAQTLASQGGPTVPTQPTAPAVAPTRRERVRSALEGLTDALIGDEPEPGRAVGSAWGGERGRSVGGSWADAGPVVEGERPPSEFEPPSRFAPPPEPSLLQQGAALVTQRIEEQPEVSALVRRRLREDPTLTPEETARADDAIFEMAQVGGIAPTIASAGAAVTAKLARQAVARSALGRPIRAAEEAVGGAVRGGLGAARRFLADEAGEVRPGEVIEGVRARFGLASVPEEATYLLPDGTLLHGRAPGGYIDHAMVGEALPTGRGEAGVRAMREAGAARFIFDPGTSVNVDFSRPLTPAQVAALGRLVVENRPIALVADARRPDGTTVSRVFEAAGARDVGALNGLLGRGVEAGRRFLAEEAGELRLGGRSRPVQEATQTLLDFYRSVGPDRAARIRAEAVPEAVRRFGGRLTPEQATDVLDALERQLPDVKTVSHQVAPYQLRNILQTGTLRSKYTAGLTEDEIVEATAQNVAGNNLDRFVRQGFEASAEGRTAGAADFVERERRAHELVTGSRENGPPYARVTEGQTLPDDTNGLMYLVMEDGTPRITAANHHFAFGSPHYNLHDKMPDALKRVLWGTDWNARRLPVGDGRTVIDTPWMVGPEQENTLRAATLLMTAPDEVVAAVKAGRLTDPEDIAAAVLRGSRPRGYRPMIDAAKRAGIQETDAGQFDIGASLNANRSESLLLDPDLGDVRAIYVVGRNLDQTFPGTSGIVGRGGLSSQRAAELVQQKIKQVTGKDVPILRKDVTTRSTKLAPEGLSAGGRGPLVERYTAAGFPDIGVRARGVGEAIGRLQVPPAANVAGAVAGGLTGYETAPEGATPLDVAGRVAAGALAGSAGVNVARGALRGGLAGAARGLGLETGIRRRLGIGPPSRYEPPPEDFAAWMQSRQGRQRTNLEGAPVSAAGRARMATGRAAEEAYYAAKAAAEQEELYRGELALGGESEALRHAAEGTSRTGGPAYVEEAVGPAPRSRKPLGRAGAEAEAASTTRRPPTAEEIPPELGPVVTQARLGGPVTPPPPLPPGGTVGRTRSMFPSGEDPTSAPTSSRLFSRSWNRIRNVVEGQGAAGKELAGQMREWREISERVQGRWVGMMPTVRTLKGADVDAFIDAAEGKTPAGTTLSPKVEKAVAEWDAVRTEVFEGAQSQDLRIGYLENYWPHMFEPGTFKGKGFADAVTHLVNTGQAATREEAASDLRRVLGWRDRRYGNLEAERAFDIPLYRRDLGVLFGQGGYLEGAANRIAQVSAFGKKDEAAMALIDRIDQEKGTGELVRGLFDAAVGARREDPAAAAVSRNVRRANSVAMLGLSAIANLSGAAVNVPTAVGFGPTARAVVRYLRSPEAREEVVRAGVNLTNVIDDVREGYGGVSGAASRGIKAVTAPGHALVERFNRGVAFHAGGDVAEALLERADLTGDAGAKAELGRLGLDADTLLARGYLTEADKVTAGRRLVERTQFKVDPQDLPLWATTPAGRVVFQFKNFPYNQSAFMTREVLQPALRGDMRPLTRFLIAGLAAGAAITEAKNVAQFRESEQDPYKRVLQYYAAVGGLGLVGDVLRVTSPIVNINAERVDPDRVVTQAVGTVLGPTVGTGIEALSGVAQATRGNVTPLERSLLRRVPVIGTSLQNLLVPYRARPTTAPSSGGSATPPRPPAPPKPPAPPRPGRR